MAIKLNLVLPLIFCVLSSHGQTSKGALGASNSNYVVIGAFANHENAIHFKDDAKANYPSVAFDIHPERRLYYVFILKTENRVQAFAETRRLRKESKYDDTWVYYGTLGEKEVADVRKSSVIQTDVAVEKTREDASNDQIEVAKKDEATVAAEVRAQSIAEEPTGLDLTKMISGAKTKQQKDHYEVIQEVKKSASRLDATTKVIVFKDDEEGRQALRSLGYEVEEGKPVGGFFDSKNNILAINATEAQVDEPFHEGLKPVVKFLRKKNPEMFESFAQQAAIIKHPTRGLTYGELTATDEEALGNMMADVAKGYFENSAELKGETTTLMKKILETLGIESPDLAVSYAHLQATATNLAIAVREATGFDAGGNRKFTFNIHNTMNSEKVTGKVDLVNESGKKLTSYPGNEIVQVMRADASGNIVLACEVLGYRKLLFKLNYDNPFLTDGVTQGDNGEANINFGLVRLQKGDIAVMYNVYFFKDAAVMRPESRYEINNLLSMMNENSTYKILIHGHTNGNAAGKIITMGESKNYFSLTGTNEGRGSSKKLSEARAEVIREYMADQSIGMDRMEIKAWGGKRPLYDKHHNLAQSNVRVEVEIIEN